MRSRIPHLEDARNQFSHQLLTVQRLLLRNFTNFFGCLCAGQFNLNSALLMGAFNEETVGVMACALRSDTEPTSGDFGRWLSGGCRLSNIIG
jgi:hypothetical protein